MIDDILVVDSLGGDGADLSSLKRSGCKRRIGSRRVAGATFSLIAEQQKARRGGGSSQAANGYTSKSRTYRPDTKMISMLGN